MVGRIVWLHCDRFSFLPFIQHLERFVSRQRHKSYWKDRKMLEEIEKQAFIDRVNAGEFSIQE